MAEEGCPWDREQTFGSLKKHLASEAEEVFQAVDNGDMENLCEELGDVLFQVMINSQIASEHGCFTIEDAKRDMESTRIMDRLICGDESEALEHLIQYIKDGLGE